MSTASHPKNGRRVRWSFAVEKNRSGRARILFLSISKSVQACWTHMFDVPIMLNAQKKKDVSNTAEATANLLMFFLARSLCLECGTANGKRMRFIWTKDNSKRRCRGKAWAFKSMWNNFFRFSVLAISRACACLFLFYFFRVCSSWGSYGPRCRHRWNSNDKLRLTVSCFFFCFSFLLFSSVSLVTSATKRVDCDAAARDEKVRLPCWRWINETRKKKQKTSWEKQP